MTRKAGSVGDGGSFVPSKDDGRARVGGVEVRTYSGDPGGCSFCGAALALGGVFTDGATVIGPWANMCPKCYRSKGVGVGLGRGQRYEVKRLDSGVDAWVKVAG